MKPVLHVALLIIAVAACSSPPANYAEVEIEYLTKAGHSGSEACEQYATGSVNIAIALSEKSCVLGGGDLSTLEEHQMWCLDAGPAAMADEFEQRVQRMIDCNWCASYASSSRSLDEMIAGTACADHETQRTTRTEHIRWCLSVPKQETVSELDKRQQKLAACDVTALMELHMDAKNELINSVIEMMKQQRESQERLQEASGIR